MCECLCNVWWLGRVETVDSNFPIAKLKLSEESKLKLSEALCRTTCTADCQQQRSLLLMFSKLRPHSQQSENKCGIVNVQGHPAHNWATARSLPIRTDLRCPLCPYFVSE